MQTQYFLKHKNHSVIANISILITILCNITIISIFMYYLWYCNGCKITYDNSRYCNNFNIDKDHFRCFDNLRYCYYFYYYIIRDIAIILISITINRDVARISIFFEISLDIYSIGYKNSIFCHLFNIEYDNLRYYLQ